MNRSYGCSALILEPLFCLGLEPRPSTTILPPRDFPQPAFGEVQFLPDRFDLFSLRCGDASSLSATLSSHPTLALILSTSALG